MSRHFVQNTHLRRVMLSSYRVWARSMFWRQGPRVFVNSLPKAGTHLLTALFGVTPGLMNARLHLTSADLIGAGGEGPSPDALRSRLASIRPGQAMTVHLPWSADMAAVPANLDFAIVNMIRDPRDMLVSRMFYIMGLRRHYLHRHLAENFTDERSRMLALIVGPRSDDECFGGRFRPYAEVLDDYLGWTMTSGVLTVRFEDLIGPRGGVAAREDQLACLRRLYDHIGLPIADNRLNGLALRLERSSSPTMRRGRVGDWRDHFDADVSARIEEQAGGLLARMGYA